MTTTQPTTTEQQRYYRDERGNVRAFPSRDMWYPNGELCDDKTIANESYCIREGDTRVDGPPVRPPSLAQQLAESNARAERWRKEAMAARRQKVYRGVEWSNAIATNDAAEPQPAKEDRT